MFPDSLASEPEPPWCLWVRGDAKLLADCAIGRGAGVVGARRADSYGREVSRDLGRSIARAGGVVVSGLAFGIDGCAHRGALDIPDGKTVAVTGGGVDVVYPRSHLSLYEEIVNRGAVVSEMPPGTGLWKWSFPARNRLIASLSKVVVVVQGARRSGSLHTAEAALARGIPVAAVPGPITSSVCSGSNQLIADGAIALTDVDSVLPMVGLTSQQRSLEVGDSLKAAVAAVSRGEVDDFLATRGSLSGMAALAQLELLGIAECAPDGRWRIVG